MLATKGEQALDGGESPSQLGLDDERKTPRDWVENPVEPIARHRWVLNAYLDMEGDRKLGMGGVRPTPFSVFDRWADREGLNGQEYREVKALFRSLDSEYVSFFRRKQEADKKKSEAKAKSRVRRAK